MSDPYRDDLNRPELNRTDLRPVVVEDESSGMGMFAGIAIAALLIVGGFLFYTYSSPTTVVSQNSSGITETVPSIAPGRPMTPVPGAPTLTPPVVNPTVTPPPPAQ